MKWFKVIAVLVVLAAVTALSIGFWVKRTAALNEEEKQLFQATCTHRDVLEAVGTVKDVAFAYGLQGTGNARKVDKHWTRNTEDDLVNGSARLNISGDKAWGQLTVYYKYTPDAGRCTVKRVEFDQLQAHQEGRR